ncbi:unnamed protein product, partial [Thlaspi arvense]
VLPIFYKVPTESVKQLVGEFGDHFRRREWEYRHEQHKIVGWKKALKCVTGKLGFTLDDKSSESNFIESIVKEVLRMLASIPLPAHTSNLEQIITTSSSVTLTKHAKAQQEVKVMTTQPKDMVQRPNDVTKRGGDSLAPHTKVSRHGSKNLVREIKTTLAECSTVNHTKLSRREKVDMVREVNAILARSPGPSAEAKVCIFFLALGKLLL